MAAMGILNLPSLRQQTSLLVNKITAKLFARRSRRRRIALFTVMVSVWLAVLPFPSSMVSVYVVVFFGVTCMQRFAEGQTFPSGGSSFTVFAFETP